MAVSSDPDVAPADASGVAIRGGAIRTLGYAVGVVVSLATATLLVRHLGVRGFGRYVTVTSLIALVGGVTEAGIVVYGVRQFVGRNSWERRRLLANLLALRLVLSFARIKVAGWFGVAVGYPH